MSDSILDNDELMNQELAAFKADLEPELSNYQPIYSPETKIKEITDSMEMYDRTVLNTQKAREELAKHVGKYALQSELNSPDTDYVSSQTSVVLTYASILRDIEKSAKDHVATKLKKKDTETNAAAVDIAGFLSRIQTNFEPTEKGSIVVPDDEINRILDEQQQKDGSLVVLDTELEQGNTQLPQPPVEDDL